MKKLYNEFFCIPKYGKVKEKVMLMHAALTVAIVVVFLFAMGFTAYACFSHKVTSSSNIIKAAYFEALITVNDGTNDVDLTVEGKYQVAALKAGETYRVEIVAPAEEGAASTGFCVISDRDQSEIYHTQQLGADEAVAGGRTESIHFTLTVSEDVDVFFFSHWGTSSSYEPYKTNADNNDPYVTDGDAVHISVANSTNAASSADGENDEVSGETASPEASTEETIESAATLTEEVYAVQSDETVSPEISTGETAESAATLTEEVYAVQPDETSAQETSTGETAESAATLLGVVYAVQSDETVSPETSTGETTESAATPTEVVYTVQPGDTLPDIAEQYDTTVAKLAAYNGIPDPKMIVPGQKISIPPADYEVPAETTPEATTSPETTTSPEATSSETTGTTEMQLTPASSLSTESTDSEETTGTTSEQESQTAEETTGAAATEVNE